MIASNDAVGDGEAMGLGLGGAVVVPVEVLEGLAGADGLETEPALLVF